MKERIKEVRKSARMTQVEFGEKLGVKGNTVTNYETGLRTPTDAVIRSICREFNVNEEWLRNGTGEMFQPITKNDEIARLLGNVSKMDDSNFRRRLINALAMLDDDGWTHLEELIDMIAGKN